MISLTLKTCDGTNWISMGSGSSALSGGASRYLGVWSGATQMGLPMYKLPINTSSLTNVPETTSSRRHAGGSARSEPTSLLRVLWAEAG